jgi:hypothetical protein
VEILGVDPSITMNKHADIRIDLDPLVVYVKASQITHSINQELSLVSSLTGPAPILALTSFNYFCEDKFTRRECKTQSGGIVDMTNTITTEFKDDTLVIPENTLLKDHIYKISVCAMDDDGPKCKTVTIIGVAIEELTASTSAIGISDPSHFRMHQTLSIKVGLTSNSNEDVQIEFLIEEVVEGGDNIITPFDKHVSQMINFLYISTGFFEYEKEYMISSLMRTDSGRQGISNPLVISTHTGISATFDLDRNTAIKDITEVTWLIS